MLHEGKHILRCGNTLSRCFESGWLHQGYGYHGLGRKRSRETGAWQWDPGALLLSKPWQFKIVAELKRLQWARKDAGDDKNHPLYVKMGVLYRRVAGLVVRERKHPSGVTVRLAPGSALPIGQQRLIE